MIGPSHRSGGGDTVPWVEKYRPTTIGDVVHQEEVVGTLTRALETLNLPHLLLHGPPGVGKTTCALAIARQLFGPVLVESRVLQLDASDERGVRAVRERIKLFAATAVGAPAKGFPSPPYKLLILDEADSMTPDAQNALRRTMETCSTVTRFVIICNHVSRIISPLESRCAKFRFKPLHETAMHERLSAIAGMEGASFENAAALAALSSVSGGDLRRAIATMQTCVQLAGPILREETISHVAGQVPRDVVTRLSGCCTDEGGSFARVRACVDGIAAEGHSARQVLLQLQGELVADRHGGASHDRRLGRAMEALAVADHRLVLGADDELQLLDAACRVAAAWRATPL